MNARNVTTIDNSRQYLPVLLLLFVGSGCAALIYEVVWFQLLQLVIGSSAISLGVLLGTFMGGMCLGSFLLPRYISARHHPLKVYAFLELGIGAMGLLLLFGMPLVNSDLHAHRRAAIVIVRAHRRGHVPAAADADDGRDAAGHVALGRDDAAGRVVARILLRRQHRRARSSAVCSRASICCACTTWRSRRTSRSR